MYKLQNIIKKYDHQIIFKNFDLNIEKNKLTCFFGESGVGKTTLISILGLLDNNFQGTYFFNNHQINLLSDDSLSLLRKEKIGFIFQENYLLNDIDVIDNLTIGFSNKFDLSLLSKINNLAEKFKVIHLLNRKTSTLSSGEKQRIALLRSLLRDPELIIADEPTGNLDIDNSNLILTFLKELTLENKTVIIVSHDEKVKKYADYCYYLLRKDDKSVIKLHKK